MKMIYFYLSMSISIIFLSFIVGMISNGILKKTEFYNNHLSNLNFVRDEKLNNYLGVEIVKWIVKNTPFKYFNQFIKVKGKIEKEGLIKLRGDMTNSEIGHLIGFIFALIVALVIFLKTKFFLGMVIILTVNILMNLYPSLLQQQNKRRIDKLLKKL